MLRVITPFALALGLLAGPASAATMEVVWTGTVYADYDGDGTDLTGETVTATMIYDTDLGTTQTDFYYQYVYGGTYNGTESPVVSGEASIGSETVSVTDPDYSYAVVYDQDAADFGYEVDQYYTYAYDYVPDGLGGYTASYFDVTLYGYEEFLPDDLETAFAVTDMSGLTGYGCTSSFIYDGSTYTYDPYVCFTVDSLTVTVLNDVAPVPLPASALLLIGAVGGMGALRLRRRRI